MTVPLSTSTMSNGTSLNSWIVAPGRGERTEQQRTDGDPEGAVAAEQGDGDAGEPVAGREAFDEAAHHAQRVHRPTQAGDRAGDQHRQQDHPALPMPCATAKRGLAPT